MDKGEWVNFLCLQMEERRRQVQEDHEREYQVSISSTFYLPLKCFAKLFFNYNLAS